MGTGAVIGANSTVTKDVAPHSIVVGSPAKHLRYRFSNNRRAELIASKWWEMNPADIQDKDNLEFQ